MKLPHKRSKGQDHWGYYNGEDSNFTLIPDFVVTIPSYNNSPSTFTFSPPQGSADREVNPSYSNASILQSITYPEGGKTTYTFENNSGLDNGNLEYFGGLRIKKMTTTADDVVATKDKLYEYEGGHVLSKPIYYSVTTDYVHAMRSQSWQPLLTLSLIHI